MREQGSRCHYAHVLAKCIERSKDMKSYIQQRLKSTRKQEKTFIVNLVKLSTFTSKSHKQKKRDTN